MEMYQPALWLQETTSCQALLFILTSANFIYLENCVPWLRQLVSYANLLFLWLCWVQVSERRQNNHDWYISMWKYPTWIQQLLSLFKEKQCTKEVSDWEKMLFFLLCLQLCTSVALWRLSWTSWNCFKARSRTQKTTPYFIWTCLQRAWRIANRGKPLTQTGSISARSLRYYEHRTLFTHTHTHILTHLCTGCCISLASVWITSFDKLRLRLCCELVS